MKVAITGSHGLIGSALVGALEQRGDTVQRCGRGDIPNLSECDAVVNLAGTGIASQRWTARHKSDIRNSRIDTTRRVVSALAREADNGRSLRFLSGSAVGFYGSRTSEELTEHSDRGTGFLASVCADWESEAATASPAHATALLRTGHVLAPRGGLLEPQRPLFRAGLGGPIGQGTQFQPWITLRDYVRALLFLLDTPSLQGPVNMTGPEPCRQREFAAAYALSLRRSARLTTPAWAPELLLGKEMTNELLLASQRALPTVLTGAGFIFHDTELATALRRLQAERHCDNKKAR